MRGMSKKDTLACQVSLGLFAGLLGIASTAHGMPVHDGGGTKGVRAGGVTGTEISPGSTTMNIDSTTANNVIGWKDFSIKSGETVQFDGGANTHNYLNIVTGNVTSQIAGKMKGGKNVYIANSHGVIFGDGASVDVGSLYVTTRKLDADAIGTAVENGTIDLDDPTSAGVTGNIINESAASSEGLAESDIVSLVDSSGSVKATKIVLEGKSVRIMNDAKIDSLDVSAVADQSALEVEAGGTKTVRAHKGYVHVGYETTPPTHGSTGKYKNLDAANNMYKLVEDKAGLDAIRTNTTSLAGNYMLRKDIDFADAAHTAIGTNADPFTGKFDGMFHEIKNMTLSAGTESSPGVGKDYSGLFGNASGAEIANVGIRDANLSNLNYGGAVVGKADNGTHIFNVYNEVSSETPAATKTIGNGSPNEAGGLIGHLNGSSLDHAYNTAKIGSTAAGLVGRIIGASQIYAVYNTGSLTDNTSQAGYRSISVSGSFIKDAYTTQGTQLGLLDTGAEAYDSYSTSTGKAVLVNNKVTAPGTPATASGGDAKQASSYNAWDISDEGGANKTWRIFAGQSNPLLTAFMQGTVQAEYSYAEFEQTGHAHSGNDASTYTQRIDGTLKTNNGESMPERTYDATYRKMTKADGTEIGGISDVTIYGYPRPAPVAPAAPNNIELNANHGRRNAGKEAMLYSGQHGYDVAGANIDIKKRSVKAGLGTGRPIEREYNGSTNMTQAFKDALTGITTDGLVAGDDVAADITNLTADTADANAGYGKTLTLGGTLTFTGNDRVNYEDIDANSGNMTLPSGLTANIRQKKVTVGFKAGKNFNKTYDGNPDVKDEVNPQKALGSDVLQLTGVVGSEDPKLNNSDITAKYMTGKTASDTEQSNAGTNVDIAYKNIKLADGTTGKAKNYRLVDAAGNVLYREGLTDEPTDMTNAANSADPRYIGAATTAGGTLWGKGAINKRNISADTFLWDGGAVTKVYDGTSEFDNAENKTITAKQPGEAGVLADEGLIAGDAGKVKFEIVGKGEFRKSDGTTATPNVSEAAKAAYKLTATNTKSEDVLQNYTIGGVDAKTPGHSVTSAGKITPRVIDVALRKAENIDKTYDGTVDAVEGDADHKYLTMGKNWVGYAGTGRLVGDTNDSGVGTDGATVTVKAVYRQKGTATNDKNVVRAADKSVIENGKDVYYTFKLEGGNAATNYTFNADGITPQAEKYATGTGKITPKKLTPTFGRVTRGYNGGSDASASLLTGKYNLHQAAGDDVKLNTNTDTTNPPVSTITGTYYKDAAKTEKAVNKGTGYTVAYKGFSAALIGADSGNYEIADAFDIFGDIKKAILTPDSFQMTLGADGKVERTYDGTESVPDNGLTKVKVGEETIYQGAGYLIERGQSKYYRKEYPLGNEKNANADETGTLHAGSNPYSVQYTITLQNAAKDNYDLSGLHGKPGNGGTYEADSTGSTITFKKDGIGYIKSRKIYVSLGDSVKGTSAQNTPQKAYDGTDRLNTAGAAAGEFLVKFAGGSDSEPTGLAQLNGAPVGKNESTGAYESRKAGDPKQGSVQNVVYTPVVKGVLAQNYVFYHAEGEYKGQKWDPVAAPLKGKGIITQADLVVEAPADVRRSYNGDTDVLATQGKLTLTGIKKHESAPGKNDANTAAGVLDDVKLNEIDPSKDGTGAGLADKYYRYYNGSDTNADDLQSQAEYVTYRRIRLAGDDAVSYRLVYKDQGTNKALSRDTDFTGYDAANPVDYYTMKGKGVIDRRPVKKEDFKLEFAGVTKVYDGTKVVKYEKDPEQANKYISEVSVDLGGTVGKKYFTLENGDYTLDDAATEYANKNVAANPGTGNVTYKLHLNRDLLKNYDFTDINSAAGYSYDSAANAVTRTLGVGTITKRPVYAHVVDDNVTKTYNAKKDVIDESGAALLGDKLVKFDNIKNGTPEAEAGLLDVDAGKNATTALYTEKNVGDKNRTINYTLLFSNNAAENAALLANYDLRDAAGNAAATLTTTTNTINRRALRLKADEVTKPYDATTTVKVGGADSTTNAGLGYFNESEDRQKDESSKSDEFSIVAGYTREYNSPNATRTEESKKNNVTYRSIQLTGADAANYCLADSAKEALAGNDTAGYTMTGYGEITPLKVTKDRFKLNFRTAPVEKTYDGTAYVDGNTENPAAWRSYIESAYVTKEDGTTKLFDIDVEKVNSATYRTGVAAGSDGTADKNVGAGKPVLFNLKFSDAAQNNFDFDPSFYGGGAGGNRMVRDAETGIDTYNVYTAGDIKKRILTASLERTMNIRKVYDGTTTADTSNLHVFNLVEAERDNLEKEAVFDNANASVRPGETANARTITYTAKFKDAAVAQNYAFDTLTGPVEKTLTATGDIEKRKVYARVTKPLEKTYDATKEVKIDNAPPANGEALVSFGKSADDEKNTGLVTGTNETTALYADADASDRADKTVNYTLAIAGKDDGGVDYAENYIIYDEAGNVVYDKTKQADGTLAGADTLTTTNNIINRAPLTLTADYAEKQYDGGRKVKNPSPETLLQITGGWQGTDSGDLNRNAYTATYLDENVNDKGVDYGNIQIVGTGTTKASNYVLLYNDKEVKRNGEVYSLHGEGAITKRILTGDDLNAGFTTTPIEKTYDGTADVKNPVQYVNYMRTRYTKDDGTPLDLAADGYKVERADYVASANIAAKDVGRGKDVNFQFALNDGNFDYSGLTDAKLGADGVYRFSQNYDHDSAGVGLGTIKGRLVGVTLRLVQKLYDGTTEVKDGGCYTRDVNGNLIEHSNTAFDKDKVFTLNGERGEIAGDANSGFANDERFDFDVTAANYDNAAVNGGLQLTSHAKDVAYDVKLKDPSANRNYTFRYRVVDADGKELAATDTAQTIFDPSGNPTGHTFRGKGDIWQKRLRLHAEGIDRDYNGKAELTPDQRRALTFDGVAQTDSAAFNFSNPNDARAAGFVNRIHGRYGDRSADAFTANAHVKRPADNINGKPEARDVEITGVKDAFESLLKRGDVANNYFYEDGNTVYGTGTIKPLTRTLQKTWQKGAAFEKMYDGDARAMIGGKHAWESAEAKQAFHDKLRLSVDLGIEGEAPIELDYSLYGDAAGDIGEPHYENFSGGTAHHGQDDANVRNSADPNDTLEKDIVYRLKSVDGDKAWRENPDAPKYKDWDLSESPVGKEVRLSDADVDNSAGVKAYITPRAITLKADEYSKIYDGTAGVAAPSLSAAALAEKERELRSKLHITDDKTKELLDRDGVDFTVDVAQSEFLDKGTYRPDADVARDAAGNVPQDGKIVEYKLSKTGGVIEQGNYVLPSGTQTDAVLGAGSITPRTVRVRFNPTDTATPDKIYDGTQYTVKDGKLFSRTFELVPQGIDEGVVETDRDDVRLNKTANIGRFASPNVRQDNGGVQDVLYNDGIALQDIGSRKAANYTLESGNLRDTARITPRPLDVYLKGGDIRKEYDGTTNVADKFQTANNIALLDRNREVEGIAKPALPTWNAGDAATYDSKNAGNRTVFYNPSWTDGNFVLQKGQKTVNPTDSGDPTIGLAEIRRLEYTAVDGDGRPQMKDGVYGMRIEADGVIDRRKIRIDAAKDADKIYDGTANVLNPLGNLSFSYNGANAEQNEANGIVEGEADDFKAALRVQGVYRSNDDSAADANAADSDAQDYKNHPVRYAFEKDEARDPVLANYEIATDAGENTVKGAGVIRRRTLNVLPDPQATYARKSNVNYTGHIEDGSAQANEGSPLTPEVAADVERFNSGMFFYGPKAGTSYDAPGQSDIQGWYRKDGVADDILASGNYGSNYTLHLKPSKLSVAPRVDSVVPERTIRPDSKVYERAAFDESNAFGKNRELDAALAYTGKGVNTDGTKPQGANVSDAGIRQQGTVTNIGGAAGAVTSPQGAASAAYEAAREAGGSSIGYRPGTAGVGGNVGLAGSAGGAYRPGTAGTGASYAQGAATMGSAGSAARIGRTSGTGSVVDRSLAAAAGMSDGSSSGVRAGADYSSAARTGVNGADSYADGSSRAADRGLANALGRGAGYYSGKGYSHTDDDEEEEIKKKTKASA